MPPHPGVMFQAFTWFEPGDGAYWDRLADQAQKLRDAGFTMVWLPPCCKGQGGVDDVGYALYDLYDLGEFDQKGSVRTRWGTRAQLEACVKRLKDAGLYTLADIILNHRMGADGTETFLAVKVKDDDRTEPEDPPRPIEAWTRFTFPGRQGKYSDFGWRWHHYTAVDMPAGGDEDDKGVYRVLNKEFSPHVGQEMGNYDFLMGCDVNLKQEDVRQELFRWGQWFLDATGIQGFRIDAAKHMHAPFLRDFLEHLREHTGGDVFTVCEYFDEDRRVLEGFLEQCRGTTHAFDFPLHLRFAQAAKDPDDFDLRTLFEEALVTHAPGQAVTFVENHDTESGRGEEGVADWFKPMAYAMILLRRDGLPCVFAGDYHGREGEHPLTRFGDMIDALIRLRQAFDGAEQTDAFDDPRRIAWVRHGGKNPHQSLVVICNTGPAGRVTLQTQLPDSRFVDTLDAARSLTTRSDGRGDFDYPGKNVTVWVAQPAD